MNPFPTNYLQILARHEDASNSLLEKAARICPEDLDLTTDPEVIKIRKMVQAVLTEGHLMKAFVRLRPLGDRALYGYMKPKHDIWHTVGTFFAKRFPHTVIVLGNNSRSVVMIYDKKSLKAVENGPLNRTLDELRELLDAGSEAGTEELWETYYWSQYCDERRNIRYYQHNMPKKYLRAAGNKVEANTGRLTLDHFTE